MPIIDDLLDDELSTTSSEITASKIQPVRKPQGQSIASTFSSPSSESSSAYSESAQSSEEEEEE
jgi:hypothetical protein